jgi:branched-chain amino acid transport system substrate-binding protein
MKLFISLVFILFIFGCASESLDRVKVGAILPLTGPGAIWGETMKNGMELASEEFDVEVIYEDSMLDPKTGIIAYENLKNKDVDVVVALASRIVMPLIPIVTEDKIPMIGTITSVEDVAKSPYVYRFYSTAKDYVDALFELDFVANAKSVGLIYVNDDYGVSVKERVKEKFDGEILFEAFEPGETDYRSQLSKVKHVEILFFAAATPITVSNILKQAKELNFKQPILEASTILSMKAARKMVGSLSEGVYTNAFEFSLNPNKDFHSKYLESFGKEPTFASAFGYDIVKLVSENFNYSFSGLNGDLEIVDGEINPRMVAVKIVDGELVVVE